MEKSLNQARKKEDLQALSFYKGHLKTMAAVSTVITQAGKELAGKLK